MRILVVDDEREHGFVMFHLLERLGHDPLLAFDPDEALSILDEADDVGGVITDIEMPGMNGVELARRIHDVIDADLPIAFCTGSDPADETTRDAATIGPVLAKGRPIAEARRVIEAMVSLWARPRR